MVTSKVAVGECVAQPGRSEHLPDGGRPDSNGSEDREKQEGNAAHACKPFKLTLQGRLIFATLAVLTLMVSLDGTSISVALPQVSRDLDGSAIEAFWTGTAFLLCSAVFQPATATLSNIFGRRMIIMAALIFFFAGTLIAGLAHSFTEILVGRSIQGVGGGGLAMLAEVVVTDVVPLQLRGKYYGILSAMYAIGSVLGPIVGGGFAENATWRWIFYINFPFIGIGAFLILFFFRLRTPGGSLKYKLRRIDYVGTVLFIGSISSFLIPVSWGGIMYDWDSWRTLVPLAVGLAGLSVFVGYECYVPEEPIIPQSIFKNRSAAVAFASSTLQGLILWCGLYYMPLYFEAVRGFDPLLTGVAMFPDTFTIAPAAIICGLVISKAGRYRWCLWVGWAMAAIGYGIMCILKVHTSTAGWILLLVPSGLGMGTITAAIVCTVQASSKPENLTAAVAMVVFFRAFGQAIGIAVGGVIFQNQFRHHLLQYPELASDAVGLSWNAAAIVTAIKKIKEDSTKEYLRAAYTDSLRVIWMCMCALAGVGLGMSFFVKEYDLNQALISDLGLDENRHSADEGGKRSTAEI